MKKSIVFRKIGLTVATLMLAMLMIVAAVAPVTATDEYTDVHFKTVNLSIDGSITLNFYIDDLGSLANEEDGYLAVRTPTPDATGNYLVQKVLVKDLTKDAKGRYVLSVKLAAAQQTAKISIQAVIGEWRGEILEYSVSDYNQKVFEIAKDEEHASYEACKEVADSLKAMSNFGAMAQAEFGYNTDDMANEIIYSNAIGENPADAVNADKFQNVPGTTNVSVGSVAVLGISAQYMSVL